MVSLCPAAGTGCAGLAAGVVEVGAIYFYILKFWTLVQVWFASGGVTEVDEPAGEVSVVIWNVSFFAQSEVGPITKIPSLLSLAHGN